MSLPGFYEATIRERSASQPYAVGYAKFPGLPLMFVAPNNDDCRVWPDFEKRTRVFARRGEECRPE